MTMIRSFSPPIDDNEVRQVNQESTGTLRTRMRMFAKNPTDDELINDYEIYSSSLVSAPIVVHQFPDVLITDDEPCGPHPQIFNIKVVAGFPDEAPDIYTTTEKKCDKKRKCVS